MKLKKVGLGDGGTRWAVDHNNHPLDGKFYRTKAEAQAALDQAMKPRETPDMSLQPTDIQLIIRDGHVYLRSPQHAGDDTVPNDYLVALGFSIAFRDPQFRKLMLALVNEQYEKGQLGDVIETHRPASTIN